ncbi:hypothetical protein G4B88_016905 [Cannabis sativa]|uniref:Uncharacterized protein n=1 Tax=Cannabis sativa TaxID=3483 RepID=A0A7J6FMA9_CANSA|nr:hypothetical protein G4B88_016905 [Cannabis sativa]
MPNDAGLVRRYDEVWHALLRGRSPKWWSESELKQHCKDQRKRSRGESLVSKSGALRSWGKARSDSTDSGNV